jgi:methanogenic corrinoid protein MtbC1
MRLAKLGSATAILLLQKFKEQPPMNPSAVLHKFHRFNPISKISWMAMSMFSKGVPASNDDSATSVVGTPSDCQSSILSIIEAQIIPRLLKAERIDPLRLSLVPNSRAMPTAPELDAFVKCCVSADPMAAQAFVAQLMDEGLDTENVFMALITPAARYLGEQWESDRMDFTQVTHGLVRLHAIAHELGFEYKDGPLVRGEVKRVMIASAPGSEHILGPTIVAEFFRKDGWQVVVEVSPSVKELAQAVSNEWFDAVGISVSIEQQIQGLEALVQQIKTASRNPRLTVILGGPIFTLHSFEAAQFGAGGICTDAREAAALAFSLLPKD